jgi:hypothetical protein
MTLCVDTPQLAAGSFIVCIVDQAVEDGVGDGEIPVKTNQWNESRLGLRVDSIIEGMLAKKNKGVMDNDRYGRG